MFTRIKRVRAQDKTYEYLQVVESVRAGGKVRQRVVCNLGRIDQLPEGRVDALIHALTRVAQQPWFSLQQLGEGLHLPSARTWGPVLAAERLWKEAELDRALRRVQATRQIQFDLSEAVFAMVLGRLMDPCSKRGLMRWKETVYRPAFESLQLQHFYRALDLLAEHKEAIEDGLFARMRDLFWLKVDLVFWDTTSSYFEGRGPEGLAAHGYSRDKRPDRPQLLIGVLMTEEGYPVAHEVFPGNVADGATARHAFETLRRRFQLGRVIFVADRGMVSTELLEDLEAAGMEYIVGMRLRRSPVAEAVLSHPGRYRRVDPQLWVKEVWVDGLRYVLCYNPERAQHDRAVREAALAHVRAQLEAGQAKALLKNRAIARLLKRLPEGALAIDPEAVRRERRYDGKYALHTNTGLAPDTVAKAYKQLWRVERAFRTLKSSLDVRPVYHWTERRVRGHVMVCFLALVLDWMLQRKLRDAGVNASTDVVWQDLESVKAVQVELHGHTFLGRTEPSGTAYPAFQALRMALPPRLQPLVVPKDEA